MVDVACPAQEVEKSTSERRLLASGARVAAQALRMDVCVLGWAGAAGDQSPHLMYRSGRRTDAETAGADPPGGDRPTNRGRVDDTYEAVKNDRHADVPLMHKVETLTADAAGYRGGIRRGESGAAQRSAPRALAAGSRETVRKEQTEPHPHGHADSRAAARRRGGLHEPLRVVHRLRRPDQGPQPGGETFVVQLAGGPGSGSYLPTERAVGGGGYSAMCRATCRAGGRADLVDRTVEAIDSLWTKANQVKNMKHDESAVQKPGRSFAAAVCRRHAGGGRRPGHHSRLGVGQGQPAGPQRADHHRHDRRGQSGHRFLAAMRPLPDHQVVAIADCRRDGRCWPRRASTIFTPGAQSTTFKGCQIYNDFRDLLARPDIDAVWGCVPDHWHGVLYSRAIEAGKDMYGEKPLTRWIAEGVNVREAVRRYGCVFQTGTMQRSTTVRHACELARNGYLGKVHSVYVGAPGGMAYPVEPPCDPPEGFDYDLWTGPAPYIPFDKKRCEWLAMYMISHYCAGFITNWGVHHLDIAGWGCPEIFHKPFEVEGPACCPRGA